MLAVFLLPEKKKYFWANTIGPDTCSVKYLNFEIEASTTSRLLLFASLTRV